MYISLFLIFNWFLTNSCNEMWTLISSSNHEMMCILLWNKLWFMCEYRTRGSLINLVMYRWILAKEYLCNFIKLQKESTSRSVSAFVFLYICSDWNSKLSSFSSAKPEALKWIKQAELGIFFAAFDKDYIFH